VAHSADSEYVRRLESRRATRSLLNAADARFSYLRLATFASGLLLAILAWFAVADARWLLLPAGLFIWLIRRHDQVLRQRDRPRPTSSAPPSIFERDSRLSGPLSAPAYIPIGYSSGQKLEYR
jgi:hypothetical protein